MGKYKLVRIEWEDAVANPNWFNLSEAKQWMGEMPRVIETGYLISENKRCVVLSSAIATGTQISEEKFGQLHFIPKKMIVSMKHFKENN